MFFVAVHSSAIEDWETAGISMAACKIFDGVNWKAN